MTRLSFRPHAPAAALAVQVIVLLSCKSVHLASAALLTGVADHDTAAASTVTRGGRHRHLRRAGSVPNGIVTAPMIGGAGFRDSPAAVNVWEGRPNPVIQDLEPVAPMDRVDSAEVPSFTRSVPLSPDGRLQVRSTDHAIPDWVPKYLHPQPFPRKEDTDAAEWDGIMIPIEDRRVVANGDQMRQDHQPDYPLVAPGDALAHGHVYPTAAQDQIGHDYARFIDQVVDRARSQGGLLASDASFACADTDQDGKISPTEFEAELIGRQNKTSEEAQVLWGKYHFSEEETMSKADYLRLTRSGFDLGQQFINRTDIASVMNPTGEVDKGFFGAGAACPEGHYATAIRLKIMPYDPNADNSAMNSVGVRCDDGATLQSIEGPDGEWTNWAECPAGQFIYGARVHSQAYNPSGDNSALSNLMLFCRTTSFNASSELVVYADGNISNSSSGSGSSFPGGWGQDLKCGEDSGLLCGVQARVWFEETGAGCSATAANGTTPDNMGITNLRLICCTDTVDCSAVCSAAVAAANQTGNATVDPASSPACTACQAKAR
mmetsp:Transcript_48850/g.116135  ORF Transcript_48850/g.116135 Transcript_48850/m.116135 type:complete len:547 (+) Transcript_48850:122-1762(+)